MGLLLHDDYNVAWLGAWELISLSVESVLSVVRGSLVNSSLKNLLLLDDLLSIAGLALVSLVNDFSLASAIVTWSL